MLPYYTTPAHTTLFHQFDDDNNSENNQVYVLFKCILNKEIQGGPQTADILTYGLSPPYVDQS